MNITSIVITCLLLGFLGYMISKKYRKKIKNTTLILFAVFSIVLFYMGVGTRVFSIFSFTVMLNQILGSFVSGFTIGLFRMKKGNSKPLIVTQKRAFVTQKQK